MSGYAMRAAILASILVLLQTVVASAAPVVVLDVEPRIVSVDGVLKVKLVSAPPEYTTIVIRLEGADKSTGYMTLSIGSVAAIDLHDYGLTPGVYSVVAYDTPGGHELARVDVLVVDVRIVTRPAVPTVGQLFTTTVFIEPPGYGYTATLYLDGEAVATLQPGEPVTLKLEDRGPHMLCVDLEATLGDTKLYARNITCKRLVLNLPPVVAADLRVEGSYLTLVIDARDPDGVLTAVEYNCVIDGLEKSGLVTGGLAHVPLFTISRLRDVLKGGSTIMKCNITAVDNAGAETVKVYDFNVTTLVASTAGVAQKPPRQAAAPGKTQPAQPSPTPGAQPGNVATAPQLPLPLPVLLAVGAAAAGALGAMVVKRRGRRAKREERKPHELHALTREDIAEIMVRLDKLESQVGETLGRLGEIQGEIDEIRKRLRALERRVDELEIRVTRSQSSRSGEAGEKR